MALRLSIGAGRGRLLRQLLTESLVLSLPGGALGVLCAWGATKAIVALMPEFYLPNEARVTRNLQVLLFSLGVSLLTGILFGLAPALRSSRPDLVEALKDSSRGAGTTIRPCLVSGRWLDWFGFYSWRSATNGSTEPARRAGT
jgi:predicted lysophospholipase L1 biosynthesis ABC-type transport system permease subunit